MPDEVKTTTIRATLRGRVACKAEVIVTVPLGLGKDEYVSAVKELAEQLMALQFEPEGGVEDTHISEVQVLETGSATDPASNGEMS
jgi:hypothetical protein